MEWRPREGDRVAVRHRPWRIETIRWIGEGQALLKLSPLAGDGRSPLSVVHPPERVTPLPPDQLRFDLEELGPLRPWIAAHRALAATTIREDHLGGARWGRVNLEAYQLAPVLRVLASPRPSLLIADDVGLGKTIEAGLCLLELIHRGRANRVLVVVPPGLLPQWQEELQERLGLAFTVIENATGLAREQTFLPAGVSPWDLPRARILTSMDYLKKDEVRRRALAQRWDLVIVDEAHALAESGTPNNPYRTPFVVHLTREAPGATASGNLESILKGKRIEARSAMGWARDEARELGDEAEKSQRVVSFSEVPLEHIYSLCADIEGRSVRLEPYGLAFTKMVARRKGVNPVWYIDMTPGRDWVVAEALNELRDEAIGSGNFLTHHGAKILPFAEPMGTWPDRQREFWWEREWRHLGDFAFDLEDVAFVICPEQEHQRFENLAKPKKCVDANWSLERMVAKLVGLTPSDISPFSPL